MYTHTHALMHARTHIHEKHVIIMKMHAKVYITYTVHGNSSRQTIRDPQNQYLSVQYRMYMYTTTANQNNAQKLVCVKQKLVSRV